MKSLQKIILTTLISCVSISVSHGEGANPENFCKSIRNINNPICEAVRLLKNSTVPEFTNTKAGIRLVNIGHSLYSTGRHVEQLVVVSYVRNKNNNQSINSPNMLCAIYVKPDNKQEKLFIQKAISELKKGNIPLDNPAYQWAQNHKFESQDCSKLSSKTTKNHISAEDRDWKLSETKNAYVFMTKNWLDNKNILLFIHKKNNR